MAKQRTQADELIQESLRFTTIDVERASEPEQPNNYNLTLATETPVEVFDTQRQQVIQEVLLMSGAEWPKQVPLLNGHERRDARSVLGSIRDIRREGDKLVGRPAFSTHQDADTVRKNVDGGHQQDISIGARRKAAVFIERGQTRTIEGRTYTGPMRVVTKWRAVEGSAVPIGADPNSKFSPIMRAYLDPEGMRKEQMNDEFRNLLIERGMSADLDDTAAVRWAAENLVQKPEETVTPKEEPEVTRVAASPADVAKRVKTAGLDAQVALDLVTRGATDLEVRDGIIDALAKKSQTNPTTPSETTRFEATGSEWEKVTDAMRSGLILRSGDVADDFKPAVGHEEFRHGTLVDMGRNLIRRAGGNSNIPDWEVATVLLGGNSHTSLLRSDAVYNVSGTFSHVTLDVANNTLRQSYREAETTYQRWAKKGQNVTDFKEIRRSILGEMPNPQALPENDDIKEVTYNDSHEGYKVELYALMFGISLQAILNNSLNAFTDAPSKAGQSFRRKINALVLQVLTDNAAMADGVALFHSTHANVGTQGVISETTLDECYLKMLTQTGLNSGAGAIVGVAPKYILMTPKQAASALRFFVSPSVDSNNPAKANIYGPSGIRGGLEPIVEPALTTFDADAWYAIAAQNSIDTVEYAFLEGFETPQVLNDSPFNRLGIRFRVVQGVGAKALDHRGMFYNSGA
jgi:hypothetical protein